MNDQQHIDHDALAELRDVMEEEFVILVNTFIQDSDNRLQQLRESAEAADPEAIRKTAHSLKGSGINIGAPALADRCREAEQRGRDEDLSDMAACVNAIEAELETVREALMRFRDG